MEFLANRKEIEDELRLLVAQEQKIEEDLEKYFSVIAGGKKSVSNNYNSNSNNNSNNSNNNSNNLIVYESSDLGNSLEKMNKFNLYQESMIKDSKTLSTQIEDCRALSERLSKIVRRLDTMQIHAQEALACTEDIINLKDCKNRITNAIEQNNLPVAVSNIRQVHEIDLKAAMTSDDFDIIVQKEQEVKELVRKEFGEAISASNINKVMSLCPLLQTLGLEDQARDTFLDFIEKQVFIAVSADASSVDGATDPATGYAQALSNVFNSTYLIIQQYLPMVIQGMENSLGDVYFIQRLHGKCEKESGLVLKRYMKYRNLKDLIASLRQGKGPQGKPIIAADMHAVMDEVALLIQYCCRYSKYLKHVCKGAESKPRHKVRDITLATAKEKLLANGSMKPTTPSASVPETTNAIVFKGPTEFDKMIDELINKYYMEGEQWLMKGGIRNALPKSVEDGHKIDECFFVLQKCGLRALATNNIHAACAVLHLISDLLSSDLLSQATEMLNNSIAKLSAIISEHMNRFKPTDSTTSAEKSASLSKGFQSAISLATTITGSYASDGSDSVLQEAVRSGGSTGKTEDPWGVLDIMEAFNIVELCARYTDRLNKDILSAGQRVFDGEDLDGASGKADSLIPKSALVPSTSSEMDKLKLCKEDFDNVKLTYSSALRQGAEKLVALCSIIFKDLFSNTFGKQGPYGGIRFDLPDGSFEQQQALSVLPKILTVPIETLINICTFNLSDKNKDMIVGMLTESFCARLEKYIAKTKFRFAGGLKMEEVIRALSLLFTRYSTLPVRGKFARLREIMLVLTADSSTPSLSLAENFSQLTATEVESFLNLRVDINHN